MKNRRPRKYKLKYMGRVKDNRKTQTKKFRLLIRELKSYPCHPNKVFKQ